MELLMRPAGSTFLNMLLNRRLELFEVLSARNPLVLNPGALQADG
jgi:hypothetical protein